MRRASFISVLALAMIVSAGRAGAVQGAGDVDSESSIAVTMLDPVPELLSGSAVTTNRNTLATMGRPVQGVDPDGVTEIVLRWPANAAGLQYSVVLFNDQGKQSTSPNNDGALAPIGSSTFTASKISVISVNTSAGPMGFALYRGPVDFPRPGGEDSGSTTRTVSIKVQQSGNSSTTTVTILRPPVMLIHGLWGEPSDWDSFTPFINDTRFSEFRADYSGAIGTELTSYTPSYPADDQGTILAEATAASLGFSFNAPTVLDQMASAIQEFDTGTNPAAIPVAGVQMDIVAHSMGGDVSRWLVQESNFLSDDTYTQGSVHKVLTIGTPHLGTPLATDMLNDDNSCVRDILALDGDITFDTAVVSGTSTTGAINDLQGNGFGGALSGALTTLSGPSPHPLPFAMIYGLVSQSQLNGLNTSAAAILLRLLCAGDPLADMLTSTGWPKVFGQSSDAVVPEVSAVNGLSNGVPADGVVHSTAIFVLGFAPPAELQQASGIPNNVVNLLNTPVTSTAYDHF
jgi:pimeloyl-ACP methyl ester carboxylesterase